ncbi:MAG: response regulator [Treponema sp.]
MDFSSDGASWHLSNALSSSFLDFFILNSKLKPVCCTHGALLYLPSFIKFQEDSKQNMVASSEVEKEATFISYLKTHFNKNNFDLIEEKLMFRSDKSFSIKITQEANNNTLNLVFSKIKDGNILGVINIEKEKKSLREKILNLKKKEIDANLFVANTSHEIRTPIQTILTVMDLLNDTKLDAEQAEYTRQIRFGASAILALVNDILDFSKLELGKMVFEATPFSLIDVVENTIDLISMEAHKKGLEVIVDVDTTLPEFIIGDANRLRQVILNLVKNAVKFTSEGSVSCIVSLSAFQREDKVSNTNKPAILFEIKDTGIGISHEKRDKLFSYFYQAEASTARKYGGTGLGLAICKNIVERMGSKIGTKDNYPSGSVFYFKLPIVQAKIPSSYENILLNLETKFLLVDDNPESLRVLKDMLTSFGFKKITLAESGDEALTIIKESYKKGFSFDIAFIDMVMPKMDGWRFVAEIESFPEVINTSLYLMIPEGTLTGDAKMKLLKWFQGYVYKPIKRRVIFNLLNDIYRRKVKKNAATEDIVELETIKSDAKDVPITQKEIASKPKQIPSTQQKKILIVDDHPVNKQLLKIILEKLGHSVDTAEDGLEAIKKEEEGKFDLIFMDVQMPILDGYEATKRLRSNGVKIPIIACTAGSQENEKEVALSFGMNDILSKPFTREELEKVLNKYLKN